jgi:hypothetical protein
VFVESSNDAKFYNIICQQIFGEDLLSNHKILVLPFGGGADIESFLNIDYFDNSGRDLFLIIDSDKQENNHTKQEKRATDFKESKDKGDSYVLHKSCIENYYHPRAFERVYDLSPDSFDFINEEANAKTVIKKYIADNSIKKNIEIKNNFLVFNEMTADEWLEVLKDDTLCCFLLKIIS